MNRTIDDEWIPSVEQVVLVKMARYCNGEEFITYENETTESLLIRFNEIKDKKPKIAAEILSITLAIHLHML